MVDAPEDEVEDLETDHVPLVELALVCEGGKGNEEIKDILARELANELGLSANG